ncbi:hypothetical protein KFL_001280210 [Klebsormidium nitens]|uniref:Nephrocystin-4 n=1 Tax=Klebsormidium nitens TaxID=105231 RepID=A0A1Y1I151_KLENI|nr:hypothetical protein KFL_001280210 [Klebsormidium nitens]|eukprot:GAQ82901.1 hypothetical protein KFL_001280210 [Klebsormidium nitens]
MENDEVMEEDIRYEHSDSERSSSGRSSDPSSEDEEENTPSSASNLPASKFTNEQARDEHSTGAAKEERGRGVAINELVGPLMGQIPASTGTSESSVVAWIGRMQEQKGRVLQIARDWPPKMGADSIPYKLTLLWMSGLTPPDNNRSIFECRVGVSLFDETSGAFFGNTCQGVSRPWVAAPPDVRGGAVSSCRLEQDVFFHTRVVDPKSVLVVELVAVEKNIHGVVLAEYGLGWSTISLASEARPTPPASLLPAFGLAREGAEVQLAWVKSGTPRYLMLRDLPHVAPPEQIPGCVLAYDLSRYDKIAPAMSLLRENELVTDRELVPGILRVGANGKPTRALKDAFSTIREPVIMPAAKVLLSNLRLRLPPGFHELLVTGSEPGAEGRGSAALPGPEVALAEPAGPPGGEPRSMYQLRVSVHNGRRFTSYAMCTNRLRRFPGSPDLELADTLALSGVSEDADVALVLELAFTGPLPWQTTHECDDCGPDGTCRICAQLAEPLPLAWAPFFPFDTTWRVRDGPHAVQMRGGPGAWPRDQLILDWAGTLSKQIQTGVPTLVAEFTLQTLGRVGPNLDFSEDTLSAREPYSQEHASFEPSNIPVIPLQNRRTTVTSDEARAPPATSASDRPRDSFPEGRPTLQQNPLRTREVALPRSTTAAAPKCLNPEQSTRNSSYTSTTQYTPEPLEPPRVRATSPEVLAERAARAAAEATKAAAAAAEGAGRKVREVELMANAMKEQLRALTEAVSRIESVVTSPKSKGAEEQSEASRANTKGREARKEMGRKERRIRAAVIIQKYTRRFLARRHLAHLQRAETCICELEQILPTNSKHRRESDSARFKGGLTEPSRGAAAPSRALRAQMHKAGTTAALPEEMREVLGRRESARGRDAAGARAEPVDMGLEMRDERSVNEVVVQFLAFTPGTVLRGGQPKSVYFTFQLYDFPPCTTETVPLSPAARAPGEPILLANGSPNPSNLLYKYRIEEAPAAARERRAHFVDYLRSKSLSVDVWDGDSMLQVGTVSVALAGLLRQGREVAEVLCDCHVELTSADVGGANSGDATTLDQTTGKILIRLVNMGRHPAGTVGTGQDQRRRSSHVSSGDRRKKTEKVRVFPSADLVKVRLAAGDATRDTLGSSRGSAGEDSQRDALESARARKEARRARLRELLAEGSGREAPGVNNLRGWKSLPADKGRESDGDEVKRVDVLHKTAPMKGIGEEMDATAREKVLREMERSRSMRKAQVIQEKLRDSATSRRTIYPAYGELAFFEEEFRNPYGQEAVFRIECSDPEMQLIRDGQEWRDLRSVSTSNASGPMPEEDLFDKEGHLFLSPHESCRLALKYQSASFPDDTGPRFGQVSDGNGLDVGGAEGGPNESRTRGGRTGHLLEDRGESDEKVVKVSLVAIKDGWPADVREVAVRFGPLVVDRTFRFYQAEHDFLKATLPLARAPPAACARSSDPRVIVSLTDSSAGASDRNLDGPNDGTGVHLKVKCGAAPETAQFYVTVYGDRYMGQLLATWRVFVHSLRRHDIGATLGQTTRSTLVVKGGHVTRHVACYCTDPRHLEIRPPELVLPAGSLTELTLAYKPTGTEKQAIRLHVVDTQSRQLVGAYMIAARTSLPQASKMFEVEVAAGTVAKKKISFTNPYPHPKLFYLSSSHPQLISFRPADVLDVPADGTRYIGLTVNGTAVRGARLEEVLIFVNDAEDKTEECLKICLKLC